MFYRVKAPWIFRNIWYRKLLWKMPAPGPPAVYLTFDDGPHETATPFVLEQLKHYHAKATFFCIGKNVAAHPELFQQVLSDGHTVGNHTYNHMNGWKATDADYIKDVQHAQQVIDSNLFRPPYGRIKQSQVKMLHDDGFTICMWDVLSGDFDTGIDGEQCLQNVVKNISPGSIIVFHDSAKAWDRVSYALPRVLEFCTEKKWSLKALPTE